MKYNNPLENYIISLIYRIMYDLSEQYSVEMRLELISFVLKDYKDYKDHE